MKTKTIATFLIACACLVMGSRARAVEPSVADLTVSLKSPDEATRWKAIDQLGMLGPNAAEAVAPLTDLLKDGSPKVRAHAAWALGTIGTAAKPSVPALVELLKDPQQMVRLQAVKAVQSIHPGAEVTIPLATKLLDDSDPAIRARVLNAIADAGVSAVPALITALKDDKAAYWACLILREIGPEAKDAVPALAEKLKDKRPEIRREAVLTLGAMNDAAEVAIPQIVGLLADEHAGTAATFVLGQLGKIPADAEAKIRANTKSADKLLATASYWALARVHPEDKELRKEVTEQLIARLKEKDPFVRTAAARALAALPPAPEITGPIFAKELANADSDTLHYALDSLAQLGPPAVPRLIDALKQPKLRGEVAYILGHIGPPAAPATNALAALVNDPNEHVAREAIAALGEIGPGAKDSVPVLVKAVETSGADNMNLSMVIISLGKIGADSSAAVPALTKRLDDPDRLLAMVSAWALAHIDPSSVDIAKRSVPVMIEGLAQPLPQARQGAIEGLGLLGPLAKDAAPALHKLSAAGDPELQDSIVKALSAIENGAADIAPGDKVVTLEDAVSIKAGKNVRGAIPKKGTTLRVMEIRGSWIGVEAMIDGKPMIGWVSRSQIGKP